MQKYAVPITTTTLVAGVFGAFLRWLQLRTAFEADTGLARPGAASSVIFLLYLLAAAAAFFHIARFVLRDAEKPLAAGEALRASSGAATVLAWLLCILFAVGGLLLMFSAGEARYPLLQRLFGASAIVAGACLTGLFRRAEEESEQDPAAGRLCAAVVTLYCCFWLVECYWVNAEDPVLLAYLPEILAVAAATLAFYYVTAYFYGKAKPRAAVFFLQFGAFLCICALFDGLALGKELLFGAAAGAQLVLEFLLLENLRPPAEDAAETEASD